LMKFFRQLKKMGTGNDYDFVIMPLVT